MSINFGGAKFGVLYNNCIWWYFNLAKFKLLHYNLKLGLHDRRDFNFASSEKTVNCQILILANISTHTVFLVLCYLYTINYAVLIRIAYCQT